MTPRKKRSNKSSTFIILEYEWAGHSRTREVLTNRTICTMCKLPAPVSSTNFISAHGPDGQGCPATGTVPSSTYAPTARPAAGGEPVEPPMATYSYDRPRTIQRETADGRRESWTFPETMVWTVPEWEMRGITRQEFERCLREAAQRRVAAEREASRRRNARGSYPSGHGSSINTVSGGLPGLGRRY